jgi:hypothetical protein
LRIGQLTVEDTSMSSASTVPTTIVEAARLCAQSFVQTQSTRSLDLQSECELENQLGRFKIWAGNLGVFAADTASADFRVKDDQDVKDVLINMLTRLREQVQQLGRPSVLPTLQEERVQDDNTLESPESPGPLTASSSSLNLSSDSDSATHTENPPSDPQRRRGGLTEVTDIINRLYRLSAVIRKPTSLSEDTRVAKYIEKTKDSLGLEDFQSYVKWQIRLWHPETTVQLIDRLSDTVMLRRKKLLYRERHQQKLNEGMKDWLMLRNPESVYHESQSSFEADRIESQEVGSVQKPAAGVQKSVVFSATKASSIDPEAVRTYTKSVALSDVTKSAVARREKLDVPAPPKPQSSQEAKCPYCSKFLKKEELKQAQWMYVSSYTSKKCFADRY